MKRKLLTLLCVTSILLSGCAANQTGTEASDPSSQSTEMDITVEASAENSSETLIPSAETTPGELSDSSAQPETGTDGEELPLTSRYVTILNPGAEYYFAGDSEGREEKLTLTLTQNSVTANEITDDDAWFQKHDTSEQEFLASRLEAMDMDMNYYEANGELFEIMQSFHNVNTHKILDISTFIHGEKFDELPEVTLPLELNCIAVQNNMLFFSVAHRQYAADYPSTAYIVAIDLNTYEVLWKTQPLTCNSNNFVVIENYIVCGYGFTDEKDYLKIIDIHDGQVVEEIPLKSMAESLIVDNNQLYVRCYNVDYVFDITIQ